MGTKKQVVARKIVELAAVLGARHLIRVTVGPSLDPVLLSLEERPDYRNAAVRRPNRYRLHYLAADDWTGIDLPPTMESYYTIQPLPRGEWLLVRRMARDDYDTNAQVFAPDGTHLRSFHAGSGIADVQATEQGHVWVSYIDEGVYGDTTLGQSGLSCLDRDGHPLLGFNDIAWPKAKGSGPLVPAISDCYALNVCSERETWTYYYNSFLLVRLLDRQIAGYWLMPVQGSCGLAVDGERVLLGGSYDRRESLFLVGLPTLGFEELTPVDEKGQPLRKFGAFGRRHHLYLQTEDAVHLVDMHSL